MRVSIFFVILLVNFWSAKAVEVSCEGVSTYYCFMKKTTEITTDNVTISNARNENITGLNFSENSKISVLPIKINEKMPNLLWIDASFCSISTIGKKNFIGLSKLRGLNLEHNKIETIASDTFDDLLNLIVVHLKYNRIKFMNGKLFQNKPKLWWIALQGNFCIDEQVNGTQKVQSFLQKITAQCGTVGKGNLPGSNCGIVSNIGGLVIGGNEVIRGQWPFLVALILTLNGKFFCGGNLISSKHVLTAAHCLHNKNEKKKLEAEDVAVLLGRHDLKARYERGSTQREVADIIIHEDWKNYTQKFDADLALLVLEIEVQFSEFIKPVCLPEDNAIMEYFDGTVIGWGMSESEELHESIPRKVSIRAVNADVCFQDHPDLGKIYSIRTFCAGGEGAGPCTGDSGGGFYVNFRGLWTLRGLVSAGALNNGGFSCDVDRFNLFTKLVDFVDWIKETVERS